MRLLLVIVIVLPIVVAAWYLSRGPWPEREGQRAARIAADSLTRTRLSALARGDVDAWGRHLRSDVLVMTADPATVMVGRDAAIAGRRETIGRVLARGRLLETRPRRLMAGTTRRGRLAWTGAELDDGTDDPRPLLRHSAAYVLQDGAWRVLVENDSRGPTWEALREGAAARRFPAPTLPGSTSGRRGEKLARRFTRWLPHLARTRLEPTVVAIGPTAGALASGDSAVRVMFQDLERRLGPLRLVDEELRVWAGNRGVGWVAAHLEASPPEWGGLTLPLRFTGVYRESGESSWRLVLAHLSVGVPDSIDVRAAVPARRAARPEQSVRAAALAGM